ncbi:MAG TPA: NmrA family NAD(P)-binding protein [Burkholderiaceae bacterium]|nr:NmrA family NAD(P)-binding protein [Burkholderiaceae bacterium]
MTPPGAHGIVARVRTLPTLVVGATGVLGRATTLELLRLGVPVRALVRERTRAAELARAGAQLVEGDLTDPDSLEIACRGAGQVFAAAHALAGRGANRSVQVDDIGHSALVAAALGAGVRRFVYTSALGAGADHPVDFFRTKHAIEGVLRASGLPFTVLRPSAFMEWHVHRLVGQPLLEHGFTVLIGPAHKPRNFVAVRDVVPFAVLALTGDTLHGRTLEIGGPDNLSSRDVAVMYRERARRGRIVHLGTPLARGLAALVRPLHEGMARVIDLALLDERAAPETWDAPLLLREFPRRLTGVDEFIDEQVRAWRRRSG